MASEPNDRDGKGKGRKSRNFVSGYLHDRLTASRIRPKDVAGASRHILRQGARGTLESLKPQKVSRQEIMGAIAGRYGDGGRARFAEMVELRQVSDRDIEKLIASNRRAVLVFIGGAILFLAIGVGSMIAGVSLLSILGGFATSLVSFIFIAIALRADFSAWQLAERRFGGLSEYFDARFGS